MKQVVILGGGTAGWMTACLIAHRWPEAGVTLVESPEIGIVGVGEGSTPQLKGFFDTLGIAEAEWMPACDATYKLGIGFHGWSDRAGYQSYFHPFPTALDGHTAPQFFYNTRARRTGRDVDAHPDHFLLPARLAAESCAPQPSRTFPFEVSYGYHFDAHKVGAFLAGFATEKLGAVHRQARVASIERAADGGVAALCCEGDDAQTVRIAGDFFVDSSGFRSLIFETLDVPFVSYGDVLFNDRAVVMPTPRGTPIASQTRATALSAGWAWQIPLTSRTGNGYVYSSQHLSPEAAEAELRGHLGVGEEGMARHLKMRVGRMRDSWSHNALAVGLAQGFLEPLEATALHLVIATVEAFLDAVGQGGFAPDTRTAFNARIAARYDGVRDYIVAHYRLNQRHNDPTGYWAQAREIDLSASLKALVSAWFTGADMAATIEQAGIARYYSAISWHCLMAGYGTFPEEARLVPAGADIERIDMARIDAFLDACALNFEPHGYRLPHKDFP